VTLSRAAFYFRKQAVQANKLFVLPAPHLLGIRIEEDFLYRPVNGGRYRISFWRWRSDRLRNTFSRKRLGRHHRRVVGTDGNGREFSHETGLPSPAHCLVDPSHVVSSYF